MSDTLGAVLKAKREELGLSIKGLADQIGISGAAVSQWEANETQPGLRNLVRASEILGLEMGALLQLKAEHKPTRPQALRTAVLDAEPKITRGRVLRAQDYPTLRGDIRVGPGDIRRADHFEQVDLLARDIPVLGLAVGGDDGDFRFNGEEIDRAIRPPGLAKARGVFALYLSNDSMYPAWREGSLFYVHSYRRPVAGDDVVIEMHPEIEGEPGQAFMKRLVRVTPTKYIVEQFNPPRQIEFEKDHVQRILRVVPWEEVIGLS